MLYSENCVTLMLRQMKKMKQTKTKHIIVWTLSITRVLREHKSRHIPYHSLLRIL